MSDYMKSESEIGLQSDVHELSAMILTLKKLWDDWLHRILLRRDDLGDPLLGASLELKGEIYLNSASDWADDLCDPLVVRQFLHIESEYLPDMGKTENVFLRLAEDIQSRLLRTERLLDIYPGGPLSLSWALSAEMCLEYDEWRVPEKLETIEMRNDDEALDDNAAAYLLAFNDELTASEAWLRREMMEWHQADTDVLAKSRLTDVDWVNIDLQYRFPPGTRRNLVVQADMLLDDGEGTNYNVFAAMTAHPLARQHHCWFFHDLYDHHPLSFREICRIAGWRFVLTRRASFFSNESTRTEHA